MTIDSQTQVVECNKLLCLTVNYMSYIIIIIGARGGVVVKVRRYKLTGRGFDSPWFHWNFSVT
jgi:hypothetical protein